MPASFTQQERTLAIDTPLGPDKLLLRSFTAREAISQHFRFDLTMLSEDHDLDHARVVGKNVTLRVTHEGTSDTRFFNGFVSQFEQHLPEGDFAVYTATVVPWFWFLTQTTDLRIFQNQSAIEIAEQVFKDFGFHDYEVSVRGQHPQREYCVQYRETAADFLSRLFEEEGVFYFYRHENGKHTMVLADSPSAHQPVPRTPEARFDMGLGAGVTLAEAHISDWHHSKKIRTGSAALKDFNFKKPQTHLLSTTGGTKQQGETAALESYDYPGLFDNQGDGDRLVRLRMEEHEAVYSVHHGSGNYSEFCAGFKFRLKGHHQRSQNRGYIITSVTHQASEPTLAAPGAPPSVYGNVFVCVPDDVPFRPPLVTPKPAVKGTQTAIVVGPAGEEIYTDEHGRIKVQFHWDRDGRKNENSSCWIRVAQASAGKGWGTFFLPRIGMEVIVDFLEGDPDRPIVIGCVYNAETTTPYKLPGDQNKTVIKTLTTKGGGGSNEIRFDDTKSSEQIFVNATKDKDLRIAETYKIYVGKSRHETVGMNWIESVGMNKDLTVGLNYAQTVGGATSISTGLNHNHTVGVAYAVSAGATVYIMAGASMVLEAQASITLRVGPSFININPLGIMIAKPGPGIPVPGVPPTPAIAQRPEMPVTADSGQVQDKGTTKQRTMKKPSWGKHAMQAKLLKSASKSGAPYVKLG